MIDSKKVLFISGFSGLIFIQDLSRCVIWMEKRRRDGNKFYKNFPVFVASSVPCFHDDREIRKNNKGFKDTKD